jgi:hypothetical protein
VSVPDPADTQAEATLGEVARGELTQEQWDRIQAAGAWAKPSDDDRAAAVVRADRDLAIKVVTLDEFVAVDEPGADALLGTRDDVMIPAGGDVMFYGDGGGGKTTLTIDLACHLAAGDDWLGITVTRPLTVLVMENEGPRPLFRAKLARKSAAWAGSPLGPRVQVIESPWATLGFADPVHRWNLALVIADRECDVVVVGPVAASGMTEAGTLTEVRAFLALVDDVRRQAGRPVTFVLVHHRNKAGQVSGAWEGAGDTLIHVQGRGHGRTRMHVQKARWSPTWHARTLELRWADGETFEVIDEPEQTDDDIAELIVAAVGENPGTGWSRVEEATPGMRRDRRRTIRDRLLADRVIVNIVKVDGVEQALDHCPERRQAHLYLAADPTIWHLRPDPGAAGAQMPDGTAPAPGEATPGDAPAHLRPAPRHIRGAGRGAAPDGPPDPTSNGDDDPGPPT